MLKILTYSWGVLLLTSACVPQQNNPYYNRDGSMPVVSASRGSGEYISRGKPEYASYISALEAARKEEVKTLTPTQSPIDEFVNHLSNKNNASDTIEYTSLKSKVLSVIWGKPVGGVGDGVTLMNAKLRARFNDALSTTPVSSQARWRHGERQFIFMPNSDIFQPYYSGGNCRDGVFVNYVNATEERVRGLFCQKGRGADWYLMR